MRRRQLRHYLRAQAAFCLYSACCLFGVAVWLVSGLGLHRLWGASAAIGYGGAAVITQLPRLRWRRELALAAALAGAVLVPLCWLAATGQAMPEVGVVEHSASLFVQHGRLYQPAAQLGADVYGYNPYLPAMMLFGLPHALFGTSIVTDPRVLGGVVFVVTFAMALRVAGAGSPLRRTLLVLGSPVVAFPLTASGNDLPVIGLICLGLAYAIRHDAALPAGLALGAAAALKATAWPVLLVVAVMFAVRDGRQVAVRFTGACVGVLAAVVGPVLLIQPRALFDNTIAFPLGLTKAHSPAASPLPGHLLSATGHAGHLAAIALLVLATAGVGLGLLVRPPVTAAAAAGYVVVSLALLFTLAPATRWGYFAYPLGILCWMWLAGMLRRSTTVHPEVADAIPDPDRSRGAAVLCRAA